MLQLPYPGESYTFVSQEIKQTSFRIDGIFTPTDLDPKLPIIFAEVQFQPDPNFYGRFYSEINLYLYQQKPGRDWLAFVLYPNHSVEKLPSIEFKHCLNSPKIKRLYLEDYQHITDPKYAILKLIACPKAETAQQVQTMTQEPDKLSKNMLEFIETVLIYKLPELSREEIRIMLALNDVQLKHTRFYQEVVAEGIEKGIQQGIEQGIQKGALKGEIQLLSRQLSKRFGPLPDWAQQNLHQANIEQIEQWGERILDANSLAEVFI